jgi:hypothetical protein
MRSGSECDRWGNCSGGLDVAIGDAVRGGLRVFDLVGRSGLKQVKLVGEDAVPLIEPIGFTPFQSSMKQPTL